VLRVLKRLLTYKTKRLIYWTNISETRFKWDKRKKL